MQGGRFKNCLCRRDFLPACAFVAVLLMLAGVPVAIIGGKWHQDVLKTRSQYVQVPVGVANCSTSSNNTKTTNAYVLASCLLHCTCLEELPSIYWARVTMTIGASGVPGGFLLAVLLLKWMDCYRDGHDRPVFSCLDSNPTIIKA